MHRPSSLRPSRLLGFLAILAAVAVATPASAQYYANYCAAGYYWDPYYGCQPYPDYYSYYDYPYVAPFVGFGFYGGGRLFGGHERFENEHNFAAGHFGGRFGGHEQFENEHNFAAGHFGGRFGGAHLGGGHVTAGFGGGHAGHGGHER